jgi:NAD(P)-dependent dehydrogenase (short-subunit alcohol dehydrogenase family)
MDFRDRHVVITGGAGALGTALARALLEAGATCHVVDLAGVERFAVRDHPRLRLYPETDLTDEAAVARVFAAVPAVWASLQIAGGFSAAHVVDTTKADLMHLLHINVVSCFLCCRAAVTAMRQAGTGGRIVNVAARPALEWRTGAGMAAYAASKAAVAAFTVALAEEVVREAILVNAVAPSIMDTPENRRAMPRADHAAWPKVEEVAQTILFLASPENRVTRGAVVPVYGRV